MKVCVIPECGRKHYARGWCQLHWSRNRVHGDPLFNYFDLTPEQNLERRIEREGDGCWRWTGYVRKDGYGEIRIRKVRHLAHRWAYELLVGPIPEGLQIDHLCRNRACVRPEHLEAVTQAENIRRGMSPGARVVREGVCMAGHKLTDDNVYRWSNGTRTCRECRHARSRRDGARKAAG